MNKKLQYISIFIAAITAYSHFFGYSYLKGYLDGAGFPNAHIELSVQETIFYSYQAITDILNRAVLKVDSLDEMLLTASIRTGFMFSMVALLFVGIALTLKKTNLIDKIKDKKANEVGSYLENTLIKTPLTPIKSGIFLVVPFIFGFAIQYVVIAFILFFVSITWLTLAFGYLIGFNEGQSLTKSDVCHKKEWQQGESRRMGCNEISIASSEAPLQGVRIYKGSKSTFFMTNKGAYEIDQNHNIVMFSPIQQNDTDKTKDEPPPKQGD